MNRPGLDYRETEIEAGGYVKGATVALVTQNKDPDGLGRVKVRYPWHEQPTDSYWARIAAPMAGKGRGLFLLPEVGDEVLVTFDREDMRFPYVLGGLWNGQDAPPEKNADGKNDLRLLKTRSGHVLLFDDGSPGRIELQLADGKKLHIDEDGLKITDTDGNSIEIDSTSGSITVASSTSLKLSSPEISVEASGPLSLKGATVTVQGNVISLN